MSSDRKRHIELQKLKSFLEKKLRKLKSPLLKKLAITENQSYEMPPQEASEREPVVEVINAEEQKSHSEAESCKNTLLTTTIDDSDFSRERTNLFDKCERKLTDLKCLYRNIEGGPDQTEIARIPKTRTLKTGYERKKIEIMKKLIAAEAREREVLIEIGKKGRELYHILSDNCTKTTESFQNHPESSQNFGKITAV